MKSQTIAFFGQQGSFTHVAARARFGTNQKFVPCNSVKEVFDYVAHDHARIGVVPIENSSGGNVKETVDCLVENNYDGLVIQESLSINVRLALMGKSKKDKINVIYSHFAPLHHCQAWLDKKFPGVRLEEASSTSKAAQQASKEKGAAAIGNRLAGQIYDLEILEFPIQGDEENVTHFFVMGHEEAHPHHSTSNRTSLVVTIPNVSGSLVDLLEPFKNEKINLTRIISRPISGHPETYAFLTDIEGCPEQPNVKRALKKVNALAESVRILGTYPVLPRYES